MDGVKPLPTSSVFGRVAASVPGQAHDSSPPLSDHPPQRHLLLWLLDLSGPEGGALASGGGLQ